MIETRQIIKSSRAAMVAWGLFCFFACMLTSCTEEDDTANEYENWQSRNETYFTQRYKEAQDSIAAGNRNWKLIRVYSKVSDDICSPTDYIIAHVISQATPHDEWDGSYASENPEYTDSVQIHYRGRLMPSASYADGFQFDSSWIGDYNLQTMIPANMKLSSFIVGMSSSLMQMHVGDRWQLCIPYKLGYNTSSTTNVPAYSTLNFDVTLMAIGKPGKALPVVR